MPEDKKRTLAQNRALHLMFTQLADHLNEIGMDMRKTLKPDVDIPWNKDTIKEYIWRPVQKQMLLKESTKELTAKEVDQVFDVLCKYFGDKGVQLVFPSIEEVMLKENEKAH